MSSPTLRSALRIAFAICFGIFLFFLGTQPAIGQESVLVTARYSKLSVYDLGLQNLTEVIDGSYITWSVAVDPNNPRLAYVGAAGYISVFDLTIGREVNRINVPDGLGFMAFSSDGKYLLLGDNSSYTLDVIDVARQTLVRKVNLLPALGTGAQYGSLGSIVVVGSKAYVTTFYPDQNRPAIAVVDLRTFTVRPIRIPGGYLDANVYTEPSAGVTPDGKYLVMPEIYTVDGSQHLLLISTKTDQIVQNIPWNNVDPASLLITPVNTPGSVYGYLLGAGPDGKFSATAVDLNDGSPTFGQLLSQTEVLLNSYFNNQNFLSAAAISQDGARLVIGGFKAWQSSPNPNVVEIDTAKMFTDPQHAIVGDATAGGGVRPYGIAIATVTTTPPPTAPTVTSVSGPITNDVPRLITITGTNFVNGAAVRIGTMPLLPATVTSPTSLHVTVPRNAPAQANLDVIVTNPNTSGPRNQQYQSGLLPAGLTIQANPAFQPQNRFASLRAGAFGVSVFDPVQGTMLDNHTGPPPNGINFNADGAEMYGPSAGPRGSVNTPQAVAWNPADDSVEAQVPLTGALNVSSGIGPSEIAASVNPATGNAAEFVPVVTFASGEYDVALEMVDTDASSPTFNTVISTVAAGLNSSESLQVWACAATPDGKYFYVNYSTISGSLFAFAVFDVVHGSATSIPAGTLGVLQSTQSEMHITPDGQSLLVTGYSPNRYAGPIAVLDIGTQPTHPVLVTSITGTPTSHVGGTGPFYFVSYQVVGKRLFALDSTQNTIVAFNFDRSAFNFSQLAAYSMGTYPGTLAVSPDGALIYVTYPYSDMISVLDANKLASGQSPLITSIGAFPAVYVVAVSPVAITPGQLQITTSFLPAGKQGAAYDATLTASGGVPPYTWEIISGSLPLGLTLSPSGQITGTPNTAGTANFTVQVADSQMHQVTAPLSINIQASAALQVTTSALPAGPNGVPYYATLAATGGVPPYTWSISDGSLPVGLTLSAAGVITGTPTVLGSAPFTVQVADSQQPPAMATRPLSIFINTGGNTFLLQGHYAIQMDGFDALGQWTSLASFVSDGQGNITGGVFDQNSVNGQPESGTFTGTYWVASSGLCGITTNPSSGPSMTLAFVISSSGSGRIIEYDDTTGQGSRASGVVRKQDPSAFSLSKINGTYAFGLQGADKQALRNTTVGEFHSDGAGNLSNGLCDTNDNGTMTSCTFSGSVSAVNTNTGRATVTLNSSQGPSHQVIYVVSAGELLMIGTDSVQGLGIPLQSGGALRQTGAGSFNNASLNGVSVLYGQGLRPNGDGSYTDAADVGLLSTDGAGDYSVTIDQNRGGVISQSSAAGQYAVASNGRVALGGPQGLISYLVSQNRAFFVGQDSKVEFGFFEPQSGGPFSNASFAGTFAGGSLAPVERNVTNGVAMGTADGAGNVLVNGDDSGPDGLYQYLGQAGTVNFAPNGRGTDDTGNIIYLISPTKSVILPLKQNTRVEIYEH